MNDISARGQEASHSAAAAPIASARGGGRISSLDFIRGLAVMGILWANIVAFGQPQVAYMTPSGFLVPDGDPDGWMWIAQFVIIDGKMRTLFTILFGAGLYLFMEKAWAKGQGRGLQVGRLLWLLLIGLLHFFFIWKGDILSGYAVCGLLALLCINWTAKTQMLVGTIVYFLGTALYTALFASMLGFANMDSSDDPTMAAEQAEMLTFQDEEIADGAVEAVLKQSGDYAGWVAHNFAEHIYDPPMFWLQMTMESWPLILIGMALYRWGFFTGKLNRGKMIFWGWVGLIGGGAVSAGIGLWNQSQGFGYLDTTLSFIGTSGFPRLPMALGMAALLVLYAPKATGWLGQRVNAAGRAAFTNYLGTSIVMLLVFHGWAGGLFGELNRLQLYLVAFLTCVLMLLWSKPWLDRFRYGPLEWLWRCLTYRRLFALKR